MAPEREFVDSNVLVYMYDENEDERRRQASDLIQRLATTSSLVLSTQVLNEFAKITLHKLKLDSARVCELVRYFTVVANVQPTPPGDTIAAVQAVADFQVSFWDGMILAAAKRESCRVLHSEDFQDGRDYAGIVVQNPFAVRKSTAEYVRIAKQRR